MLKIVAAVRRKPGMTHAEFVDYIVNVHGKLAKAVPLGVKRYVQNHVLDGSFGSTSCSGYAIPFHRDSITELFFETPQDLARTFADEYTRTVVGPDGKNFADFSVNEATLTKEFVLSAVAEGQESLKIMHFLVAHDQSAVKAVQEGWLAAHEKATASAPEFAASLLGTIRAESVVTPSDGPMGAYFGGEERQPLAVVASHWVKASGIGGFRAYDAAMCASQLYDPARGYYLVVKEHEIFAV